MSKRDTYFDNFIKGLTILRRYHTKLDIHESFSAEHDIIYIGPDPENVSEKDRKTLDELGFHECSDVDAFGWFT